MPPVNIRQRAISLIEQLPQNKLQAVVQLLEVLSEPTAQAAANAQEAQLLGIIQRGLSEPEQSRLNELRDRCEWGELTTAEHQELIGYEDRMEQYRVERLEALMELAKLRNLDVLTLNQQVSAQSHPSNAA
ncbi:hypothetical protein C7271_08810 [filamentous cyanobacterium CCP5]|nr:hypothetical protein C7271_08810 [filamentous cyanobacterium CCP5]